MLEVWWRGLRLVQGRRGMDRESRSIGHFLQPNKRQCYRLTRDRVLSYSFINIVEYIGSMRRYSFRQLWGTTDPQSVGDDESPRL